jgi:hypothetical protein
MAQQTGKTGKTATTGGRTATPQRAFKGGDELSDWLVAEAEIDTLFHS